MTLQGGRLTTAPSSGFLPIPKVFVPPAVWQKMMFYVQLCPIEINGFGYIDRVGSDFVVSEVFILEQTVSAVSANVSPLVLARHQTEMIQRGDDPSKMRFQWHSHVQMNAYFSATDLANIEGYDSDWMVSLVGNKYQEYEARLDIFRPFRVWTPLDVVVTMPTDQEILAACREDIRSLVRRPGAVFRRGVRPREGNEAMSGMPAELVTVEGGLDGQG